MYLRVSGTSSMSLPLLLLLAELLPLPVTKLAASRALLDMRRLAAAATAAGGLQSADWTLDCCVAALELPTSAARQRRAKVWQ